MLRNLATIYLAIAFLLILLLARTAGIELYVLKVSV